MVAGSASVTTTDRIVLEGGFDGLLEVVVDAIVMVDAGGEIVLVNAQTERLFGYRREELLGRRVEMLMAERFRERHVAHRSRHSTDPHSRPMGVGLELYGRRKDGSEFPAAISLSPLGGDRGLVLSAICDMTDRKRIEQDARHFRALVESSHDAIIGKDLDGVITSWNTGAQHLYGYSEAEMRGKSVSVLIPAGRDDDLPEILRRVRSGERVDDFETVRVRKDGTQFDVALTVSPIRDADGNIVGGSTIARDIGVRLHHQKQLRFFAEHDTLTGVHNRRRFARDLSKQIERSRRYKERAALLLIDLDAFKHVNDTYGHDTGDRALKEVADTLTRRLRANDLIARIGGDEFAVLLPYADAKQGQAVSGDLCRIISERTIETGDGFEVCLSASVGFSPIDQHTESVETALAAADRAMYVHKRRNDSLRRPPHPKPQGTPA